MRRGGENSKMSLKRRFASVFSVFFLFLDYQYSKKLIFNQNFCDFKTEFK
jgi:hypothetical protein